jgi:phosphatidylglycerophosphatase A
MKRIALSIATCGYLGYAPIAPGTVGSAAGVALFYAIRATGSATLEIATILVLLIAGVWSATIAEEHLGLDPGPVVIDEVAGMLITLALLPVNVTGVILAFVVFRILDVVKPSPAGRFESLRGGIGVMADDAMAAVYGNLIMRGAIAAAPGWFV